MRDGCPLGRTEGFTTHELGGELILSENLVPVLRLNGPAAEVYRHCDGERTIAELVALLGDEDQTMVALDELDKHGLIASGYEPRAASAQKLNRRQFVRRLGAVAAVGAVLPVVYGAMVPAVAAADGTSHYVYHGHYIRHHPHRPHEPGRP